MNPRAEDSDGSSTCQMPLLVPPSLEELNALLPGYEFLEFVDHGGMGVVYKAHQKSLNRIVAIKTLPPAIKNRRTFAERFKREAQALASLTHPNIVSVYDSGETSTGVLYYVMEFVQGSNLRRLMKGGGLDPRQMLMIMTQVCGALQYAHARGVVHRDIKPGNILMDEEGNAKVADFGLAKVLGPQHGANDLTSSFEPLGTPDYAAPEVLTGDKAVDHRADIYSLGVMLYEMSTGQVPKGSWDPPSMCGADLRLDEVVRRALRIDPGSRYQHVDDLSHDLDGMLAQNGLQTSGGLKVHTPAKSVAKHGLVNPDVFMVPLSPQAKRRRVRQMGVLLLVCGVLALAGIGLRNFPAAREALSHEAPPKTPEAMMRDQRSLAKWVFEHGGLVNVVTASQKTSRLSDDDGLRNYVSLPKEDFTIVRVSFSDDESFTDKDLAGFLSLAENAQTVSHLCLRGTRVTPSGLALLQTLKKTLTNLNIRNTSALSEQSLPFIAECDRLKMLFVSSTSVDSELTEKLHSVLPDCEIFTESRELAE